MSYEQYKQQRRRREAYAARYQNEHYNLFGDRRLLPDLLDALGPSIERSAQKRAAEKRIAAEVRRDMADTVKRPWWRRLAGRFCGV